VLLIQLDGQFIGTAEASVVTGTAGDVYSWGRSYMLGINETNTTAKSTVPEPIKDPVSLASDWSQDFVSVGSDSGSGTTCGVTSDGTGYCWGSGGYGQLGNDTTDYSYFPVEELVDEAVKVADTICDLSRPIVMLAKESVNRAYETTLNEGVRFERRLFHSTFATHDQKEGMVAFVEKRQPDFRNS
jgi:hypothetical protein